MNLGVSITRLEGAQLIQPSLDAPALYSFKHALVQDIVYSTLLKNERRRLHEQVAQSLEANTPNQTDALAAALAEHFWAAENWERAALFAQRAGTNALRVYALREALGYFERALSALAQLPKAPPVQMYDVLMGWAEAASKFRPYGEQLENLKRAETIARELDDKPRLARALYRIGGVLTAQGHSMSAIAPLAECFTLANELGDERFLAVPTYFMGMATFDTAPRAAVPLFDRAIELARRYDDPDTQAVAGSAKAWALARVGEFAGARAAVDDAQMLLPEVKSPMAASDVDLFAGWAYLQMGDTANGLVYGQRGVDRARQAENMDCLCGAFLCVGFNQLTAQRLPQAQDAFHEAIRESQFSGADAFENLGRAGLALAEFYSGGDTVRVLEQVRARALAMRDGFSASIVSLELGAIYVQRKDAPRAEAVLDGAYTFFRDAEMAPSLARTLDLLAQAYEEEGRTAEAAAAHAQAAEWQHAIVMETTG